MKKEFYVMIKCIELIIKECKTCNILKPPRSFHCDKCDACIELHDHHCPWTGTCVGKRNHKHFITFLITTSIVAIFTFVISLLVLLA